MLIRNLARLSNEQLYEILTSNGYEVRKLSGLFSGSKKLKVNYLGTKLILKNQFDRIEIDIYVPFGVRIFGFVAISFIASILLSLLFGQEVILRGGFLSYILGIVVVDAIYKSSRKINLKDEAEKIQEIIRA